MLIMERGILVGWHIIMQPNKQFSIWSTIVDDFVYEDLIEEDAISLYINRFGSYYRQQLIQDLEKIKEGIKPYEHHMDYEECCFRACIVHGSSKEHLNHFLKDCEGKTIGEINDLLDTRYEDWLYKGEEELRIAILHYTLMTSGIEKNTEMYDNIENVLKENSYI